MWKNAEEFFGNVSESDYIKLNEEKVNWYKERFYMDDATKMHDFYKEAVRQNLIEEKEDNITVEYFSSSINAFMLGR